MKSALVWTLALLGLFMLSERNSPKDAENGFQYKVIEDTSMPVFLEPEPIKFKPQPDNTHTDPNMADFELDSLIEDPSQSEFYKD
jgi:hypothetical protein